MLWCKTISASSPIEPGQDLIERGVIRIVRIALRDDSLPKGKSLFVRIEEMPESVEGEESDKPSADDASSSYTICRLEKGSNEGCTVDLPFWPGDQFRVIVEGPEVPVDLIGRFELFDDVDESDDGMEEGSMGERMGAMRNAEEMSDSEITSDDEDVPLQGAPLSGESDESDSDDSDNSQAELKPAKSKKITEIEDSDESEEEEDEEEDKGNLTPEKAGKKRVEPPKKAEKVQKPAKADAKKQKTAPATAGDEQAYVDSIVALVKSKGSTTLTEIGSNCTKPAAVKAKLGKLLTQHADKFVVKNGKVSLK